MFSAIKKKLNSDPVYNLHFILMCLSSLLFSASFNMMIPELPAYLSSMGGAEYKGFIIALFTLTAGISRPFSGKLTDKVGRVPIMAVGSIVCFVCGILYPVLTTVSGFLFLRLVHGFSTGFKPTATAAYIADIIPRERWGEALGLHGICFSIGMAIGPALGSTITLYSSINVMFFTSSFFALLSILILFNMKETLQNKQKFSFGLLKISKQDVFAKEALPAALITFLSYVAYGSILTLIPDWTEHLGFQNKGVFFIVFTISSMMVRFFAGKISDQKGRVLVIKLGLVLLIVALVLLASIDAKIGLILGGLMYGISTGILSPALNAWTIDFSKPDERGKAMATMYIAMEAGIGLGALCAGWYFQDYLDRIPMVIYVSAFICLLGTIYMLKFKNKPQTI
ncbi:MULTISPECIES: MFS transporter [Empedobacter]|uniref:MFS transporter n=2 Tax=Empedobacter TaxID=59734 RepID=A0A7H9DTX6_9FLAO|nr:MULTISPECIES: MFS transporter [Empedobacter]HAR73079.1 MFS transporter [Flavobacteriaceae bacterium]MDH2208084.1 MFS transporter [Empedobacter sp. GD03644]MDM1549330.1 MFS transporter [Empedobacter falsenii]QLL58604.1 MFS transporter [Empedobacter falsenii]TGN27896.1 MFS transporter [Empedobacter tilapiae]